MKHIKHKTSAKTFSETLRHQIYGVGQKVNCKVQTLVHIFAKYRPTFKILSPAHSVANLQ